jgi:hypothetical protein
MARKTLNQRRGKKNRISRILKEFNGSEKADDIMLELMDVLTETNDPPRPGALYIFVYNAKTPNMRYDQNPLVAVTGVYQWGFRAFNYHWGNERNYTWDEVAGGMYEVYKEELSDLRRLPFGNIRLNS